MADRRRDLVVDDIALVGFPGESEHFHASSI
jgi:hypothetical protein